MLNWTRVLGNWLPVWLRELGNKFNNCVTGDQFDSGNFVTGYHFDSSNLVTADQFEYGNLHGKQVTGTSNLFHSGNMVTRY